MEDMKTASMTKKCWLLLDWWPKKHEILTQDSKFNRKDRVMPQSVTGNQTKNQSLDEFVEKVTLEPKTQNLRMLEAKSLCRKEPVKL